jgi:hypothetical protein
VPDELLVLLTEVRTHIQSPEQVVGLPFQRSEYYCERPQRVPLSVLEPGRVQEPTERYWKVWVGDGGGYPVNVAGGDDPEEILGHRPVTHSIPEVCAVGL